MFRRSNKRALTTQSRPHIAPAHVVESEFSSSVCRFLVHCSCGDSVDTNYIDEALEWRELHLQLAPLMDELVERPA